MLRFINYIKSQSHLTGQYPNDSMDNMLVIFFVSSSPSTKTSAMSLKQTSENGVVKAVSV